MIYWHQCTCQKVDEDFSKQMWTSCIIQTLTQKSIHNSRPKFRFFSLLSNQLFSGDSRMFISFAHKEMPKTANSFYEFDSTRTPDYRWME